MCTFFQEYQGILGLSNNNVNKPDKPLGCLLKLLFFLQILLLDQIVCISNVVAVN